MSIAVMSGLVVSSTAESGAGASSARSVRLASTGSVSGSCRHTLDSGSHRWPVGQSLFSSQVLAFQGSTQAQAAPRSTKVTSEGVFMTQRSYHRCALLAGEDG